LQNLFLFLKKNFMQNKNQKVVANIENVSFVDPKEIIKKAGIKKGDKVADFGCGPGYFSIPIAKTIGENGEVYAFDVLPSAIEALESQARLNGIDNISIQRVNLEKYESSGLENDSMNWVILKDILFQNKDKETILKEAYRVLKKGGKVLIMEWNKNLSVGPDEKLRVDHLVLSELIMNVDFIFEKQSDAGDYHYTVIATKL